MLESVRYRAAEGRKLPYAACEEEPNWRSVIGDAGLPQSVRMRVRSEDALCVKM